MDLTGIEGLTEAQIEAITAKHNDDVTGLKNKNTELLGKMDSFKGEMSESAKAIEEARQVAVKAEAEKQEALGNYAEAQTLREQERAELVAKAEGEAKAAKEMLKQRDLKDVHFDVLTNVHPDLKAPAQAMLNMITDITYDENGNAVPTISYDGKQFNTTADFLEFAKTNPTWSAMLKAPNTKGINVHSSNTQGGGELSNKPIGEMTMSEKKAFLAHKFKNKL